MKCHKVKPVREAAGETYKLLKELQPPISEQDLALLEDRPVKSGRSSAVGYKSPGRLQGQPLQSARNNRADVITSSSSFLKSETSVK